MRLFYTVLQEFAHQNLCLFDTFSNTIIYLKMEIAVMDRLDRTIKMICIILFTHGEVSERIQTWCLWKEGTLSTAQG